MQFETSELQRLYELVTDKYHQVYNHYLETFDDDEAFYKALKDGYEMVTDYKIIAGKEEFVTTYTTPTHVLDVWYGCDEATNKRVYTKGFLRISTR